MVPCDLSMIGVDVVIWRAIGTRNGQEAIDNNQF